MRNDTLAARAARLAAVALAALAAAGCAIQPTHPDAFAFGVMGDTQYNAEEERAFVEMLGRIGAENLAFVVHVGDIMGGVECSDELYRRRHAEYDASAHPFVYLPGDNEWTDCRQPRRGARDPVERLERIRSIFFEGRQSLGRKRIEMLVQNECLRAGPGGCECATPPENRFWSRAGVRFVTLSVPGSENNMGYDADSDREARCRNEANELWLERAVAISERSETRALVVFIHANPWDSKKGNYDALRRQIEAAQKRLGRPLLLVHGDSHTQRIDTPFTDPFGNVNLALTRLETYGSPFIGWIKVTVDPDLPAVFRFEPKLHRFVPPK